MTFTPTSLASFVAHFENKSLDASKPFYYETATNTINFGYGINLTAAANNSTLKSKIITWLSENGISADNTSVAGVPWSSFSLTNINGLTVANSLNGGLPKDVSGKNKDWTQASLNVEDSYISSVVDPELKAYIPNLSSLPATTQWALKAMYYNGPGTLGDKAYNFAKVSDLAGIAEQLAFNPSAAQSGYSGLEERYLGSALLALGVIPTYEDNNQIIRLDASKAKTSDLIRFLSETLAADNTLGFLGASAQSYISAWNSSAVTASYQTIISDFESTIKSKGYYVAKPTDTTWDTIASSVASSLGLTGDVLFNINKMFTSGLDRGAVAAGQIVYLPIASRDTSITQSSPLAELPAGESYVFDSGSNKIYTIGSRLDGAGGDGALWIDTVVAGTNKYRYFAKGTYDNFYVEAASGCICVVLAKGQTDLATLKMDPELILADGTVIHLSQSNLDNLELAAAPETGSAMETLVNYLAQMGVSMTAEELDQLHRDTLYPNGGTVHVVKGSVVDMGDHAIVTYASDAPGAVIAGQSTATVTRNEIVGYDANNNAIYGDVQHTLSASNVLNTYGTSTSGNIARDTITGIQVLQTGNVTLTAEQFAEFGTIRSINPSQACIITAAKAGTYSLAGKTLSGKFDLHATDWLGTTLVGNDQDGQTLTASLLGDDTLHAGNGAKDWLFAGNGNDTLIGGNGGDTFYSGEGVDQMQGGSGDDTFMLGGINADTGYQGGVFCADGSVIDGGGGINLIVANGRDADFSKITLRNIQRINACNMTVTAAQFAGFTEITALFGSSSGIITIADAGTYDLSGKTVVGNFMIDGSSGDDSLLGGTGGDRLYGGAGDDYLTGGAGADTLSGGDGDDTIIINYGDMTSGEVIDGGAGTDALIVSDADLSVATISSIETLEVWNKDSWVGLSSAQFAGFVNLAAENETANLYFTTAGTYNLSSKNVLSGVFNLYGSDGDDVLIGNASSQRLFAGAGNDTLYGGAGDGSLDGGAGNDTLYGGDGDDTLSGGAGVDKMYGGAGNDQFSIGYGEESSGEIVDGGDGIDTLIASDTDLSLITIQNVEIFSVWNDGSWVGLNAQQFNSFSSITAQGGTANLVGASAGTYSLAGKDVSGVINLYGSQGDDILIGNATAQTLFGDTGNDILDGKGGADTLNGGVGNDTYIFGLGYGANTISDYDTTANNADVLSFGTGISDEKLWFAKSGNDLVVSVLGTTDSVTVSNWYSDSAYDLESFTTSDGLKLDGQFTQLVSAMASYAAQNTGFNPTTATTMPTDRPLQSAIAAAWHA